MYKTDIEIAQACTMQPITEIAKVAGVDEQYLELYGKYKAMADRFGNLHLLGRLAEYKYYNMDAIAAKALELAKNL